MPSEPVELASAEGGAPWLPPMSPGHQPVEFNLDFIVRMIPKVEWVALLEVVDTLHLIEVPKELIQGYEHEEFLRKMHHVLLEVEVLEGTLQCPELGHLLPISCGIPNMLLSNEETET